ncbi:hypothetical protein [Streptomyces sp. AK02-01A]|uniref:hypothetical protein n=1 Tax=Streptomyces sp. AK02-01A TaxID=3028648 RepID=UPI0029AE4DE2|nr:hypothetical protein [Streptomyces sp. AK02-01A]MDX3849602.1 hypothetical protein [Streptomyces sp. AK02-01A]MDX3849828.1 hypothetical protein [Streptomyces sp. AK02-01A]
MTACAIELTAEDGAVRRTEFAMTADGTYAARLTLGRPRNGGDVGDDAGGDAWFPERWTLDGPEPYAVSLPLDQPEEPGTEVLPLADGRVLIRRRVADRHDFSLLYPTGPGTGQLPVGAIGCPELTLLPPSPDGRCVYALSPGEHSTAVWLVADGGRGPERVAEVPGRCSGGVWLDRTGRMLALDRERDGVVKAVVVDLERGGEVSPLLQITEESNDRLLLADADSGLLLIRSDAPGHDRLGWGVLGSPRPVRFPESLRQADCAVTPFAVQPGQALMPESCAVAFRIDGAAGSWVGVWRPMGRGLRQLPAPEGWLAGAGLWTREGVLRLPYATAAVPCGLASLVTDAPGPGAGFEPRSGGGPGSGSGVITEPARTESADTEPSGAPRTPVMCRPVPLQQAPLTGRAAPG